LIGMCCGLLAVELRADEQQEAVADRPAVKGTLLLNARSRDRDSGLVVVQNVEWQVAETAIIICDMWDDHYCQSSAQRVGVMAPRMNEVVTAARNHGVMVIHAPSGCMDVYADTPYRRRMMQA